MEYLDLVRSGRNQWWTYLIGVIILLAVMTMGYIPLEIYFEMVDKSQFTEAEYYDYVSNWKFEELGLDKNIGLMLLISSFGITLLALYYIITWLHKRKFSTLINKTGKLRRDRLLFAFTFWALVMIIELFIDMGFNSEDYHLQFDLVKFLPLLVVSLLFLPIQTSCEEFIFRGYFLQAFGLLTRYPIIPIVLTSLLFAAAHMANPEVLAFGWPVMFTYYFSFAFALALLTIWDKGSELALGVHAANNILSAITLTYSDSVLQTDALWKVEINHIGWLDILFYISFFCLFIYAYYFWFIKRASGHVIRS